MISPELIELVYRSVVLPTCCHRTLGNSTTNAPLLSRATVQGAGRCHTASKKTLCYRETTPLLSAAPSSPTVVLPPSSFLGARAAAGAPARTSPGPRVGCLRCGICAAFVLGNLETNWAELPPMIAKITARKTPSNSPAGPSSLWKVSATTAGGLEKYPHPKAPRITQS